MSTWAKLQLEIEFPDSEMIADPEKFLMGQGGIMEQMLYAIGDGDFGLATGIQSPVTDKRIGFLSYEPDLPEDEE